MTDADCTAITDAIVRESGRIGDDIQHKVIPFTPWIAMTPRDSWPDGMGIVQTTMMFERMLPADDAEAWANVAPSDGSSNNCLPPTEIIDWGQSLATWQLQKIAKETKEFCVEDLRSAFELKKILDLHTRGLTGVTRWVWENRDRNEFIRIAQHKVTERGTATFSLDDIVFDPTKPPTSRLTWGTLERIYGRLAREGASGIGFNGNSQRVYALMTDEQTIRDLVRDDPELRQDFRFAFEGSGDKSPLLDPLFSNGHAWNGYKPMTDLFPARYEIVNGAYVRVQPYKSAAAASSGTKRDLNPAYEYATYQDTVVHVPEVYTQRIPNPISNPGGDFVFRPVDYMGNFKFVMDAPGSKCNPDGTIGRFRAVYSSASEPIHPEYGFVVRHLNCQPLRLLKPSCYS